MNKKTQTIFVAVFAIMLTLSPGLLTAAGQKKEINQKNIAAKSPNLLEENANQIIGTWFATVSMRNCQTNEVLRSFPVLNTFQQGGTMMETSRSLANRSPGLGVWERISGNTYKSIFIFFRSNPDGTDNGYQKVKRQHMLDGKTLTTVATFENFNPQGVLTSTGCATETATRLVE